jgi:hypothetical protein
MIGIKGLEAFYSEQVLVAAGPRYFGFDIDYVPIKELRDLPEKGSSPTELGVIRPKTANAIGLLPIKKSLARLSGTSLDGEEVSYALYIRYRRSTGLLCS